MKEIFNSLFNFYFLKKETFLLIHTILSIRLKDNKLQFCSKTIH